MVPSETGFFMVSMIVSSCGSCASLDCAFDCVLDGDERSEDGHEQSPEKRTLPSLNAAA